MLTLYTFNISHFSEKARWALDYEGVPYQEQALLPGLHPFLTRRLARRTHVTVLQDNDHVVQGSSEILDYIAERLGATKLTPRDSLAFAHTRALETRIDRGFGLGVQRLLYAELLKDRGTMVKLWAFGGPAWADALYAMTYPLMAALVRRTYRTNNKGAIVRAQERLVSLFDELDAMLTRQRYLGGDQPSRLDITVAALLAPLCHPPQHRITWPALPPVLSRFTAPLQCRPTWNHALHMYNQHRVRD